MVVAAFLLLMALYWLIAQLYEKLSDALGEIEDRISIWIKDLAYRRQLKTDEVRTRALEALFALDFVCCIGIVLWSCYHHQWLWWSWVPLLYVTLISIGGVCQLLYALFDPKPTTKKEPKNSGSS